MPDHLTPTARPWYERDNDPTPELVAFILRRHRAALELHRAQLPALRIDLPLLTTLTTIADA